jgi:hypothetical protein
LASPLAQGSVVPLALFSVRAGAGSRFGKATPAGKSLGFKLYHHQQMTVRGGATL